MGYCPFETCLQWYFKELQQLSLFVKFARIVPFLTLSVPNSNGKHI